MLTATTDPSICRIVTDDQGNPLSVVKSQLQKPDGTVGATITTGSNGMHYIFPEVEPATDVLDETNPPAYPCDVSDDWESTPDGDKGAMKSNADNRIPGVLIPAKDDDGNNFVDDNNGLTSGVKIDELQKPDRRVVNEVASE